MRKVIGHNGFLEVIESDNKIILQYAGNMGNSLKTVEARFSELYPTKSFDKLIENCACIDGYPDYFWRLDIYKDKFDTL